MNTPANDIPSGSSVKKVIVAIHGIGDQVQFATIQQTAKQFNRRLCPKATTIPLGHFPATATSGNPVYILPEDPTLGFAEAYWADIPRRVAAGGYQLEETRHWASTVAARAAREHPIQGTQINFRLVSEVVGEMVETIATLQRLIFIANKAGVGKFDLDKILVDYVDDVQLVAEFEPNRTEIVGRFTSLMESIATHNPNADIFVVAHSEGTVVAWLGLLEALWGDTPPWLKQVKGLMTFGSPIDKHLVLWPEIFRLDGSTDLRGTGAKPPVFGTENAIKWKNYYDFGDPIGFELDTARYWLDQRDIKVFKFDQAQDDIGFARYLVPGAAHNDYWGDKDVFDHFIDTVVQPDEKHPKRPTNRFWAWPVSYLLSYGVCFLLIVLGVWTVDHFLSAYHQAPVTATSSFADAKNLLGIAGLLAGVTVLARIPRLVNPQKSFHWLVIALGIFGVFSLGYAHLVETDMRTNLGLLVETVIKPIPNSDGWLDPEATKTLTLTIGTIVLALILALASAVTSRRHPTWGMKPLLIWGGTSVLAAIILLMTKPHSGGGSPWKVVVSGICLLYLWWLAAMLFDLVFVWHRYIRHDVGLKRLRGK